MVYRTLQAALLSCKSSKYQEWGLKINGYDSCSVNKIINRKQCTIIWHVDNLKISHTEWAVVEDVLKKITNKFGKNSLLATTRGEVLEHLGMSIVYRQKGKERF